MGPATTGRQSPPMSCRRTQDEGLEGAEVWVLGRISSASLRLTICQRLVCHRGSQLAQLWNRPPSRSHPNFSLQSHAKKTNTALTRLLAHTGYKCSTSNTRKYVSLRGPCTWSAIPEMTGWTGVTVLSQSHGQRLPEAKQKGKKKD